MIKISDLSGIRIPSSNSYLYACWCEAGHTDTHSKHEVIEIVNHLLKYLKNIFVK